MCLKLEFQLLMHDDRLPLLSQLKLQLAFENPTKEICFAFTYCRIFRMKTLCCVFYPLIRRMKSPVDTNSEQRSTLIPKTQNLALVHQL